MQCFAKEQPGLQDSRYRPQTGNNGHIVTANGFHTITEHKGWEYCSYNGEGKAIIQKVWLKTTEDTNGMCSRKMYEDTYCSTKHGISRKPCGAYFRDDSASSYQIKGISNGAKKYHQRTKMKTGIGKGNMKLATISDKYAQIRKYQCKYLIAR